MKKIDISSKTHPNTFALVDDCNYDELNCFKWHAQEQSGNLYATRSTRVNGKYKLLYMHTAIMGRVEGKMADHRNGITLDNQRCNLRHCTNAENLRNRGPQKNNTSGYKGVYWSNSSKKWRAYITYNGTNIHLGYFFCLIKAAAAYDKGAIKYHGEFANTNFPIQTSQ